MPDTLLVLAGQKPGEKFRDPGWRSEMLSLCLTAGYRVADTRSFPVRTPRPDYYLGKGRVEELARRLESEKLSRVVFDVELSPTQHRNLSDALSVEVIDRTALILAIFATRARSSAGKLQVELARARYLSTRLAGKGGQLSRLGGGVGTRGPGEMKIEVDRRSLRRRVRKAEKEIGLLRQRRRLNRERHRRRGLMEVALVGYTNAGKSSLLNALCRSRQVREADQLFSTLDPTTRRVFLEDGLFVLATDTVGFLRDLPHELIDAFHATLEGLIESDLLLVVVDGSDDNARERYEVVKRVLEDVSAGEVPALMVVNKTDLMVAAQVSRMERNFPETVFVSARRGDGVAELKAEIRKKLFSEGRKVPAAGDETASKGEDGKSG